MKSQNTTTTATALFVMDDVLSAIKEELGNASEILEENARMLAEANVNKADAEEYKKAEENRRANAEFFEARIKRVDALVEEQKGIILSTPEFKKALSTAYELGKESAKRLYAKAEQIAMRAVETAEEFDMYAGDFSDYMEVYPDGNIKKFFIEMKRNELAMADKEREQKEALYARVDEIRRQADQLMFENGLGSIVEERAAARKTKKAKRAAEKKAELELEKAVSEFSK